MEVSVNSLSLLKVGELAKRTGKTVRAVHLYEELGLLEPAVRSKGGFRLYSSKALKRVDWIQKLQDLGFSLTEIKAVLRDWEGTAAAPPCWSKESQNDAQAPDLHGQSRHHAGRSARGRGDAAVLHRGVRQRR